jgi:hypothetical protein
LQSAFLSDPVDLAVKFIVYSVVQFSVFNVEKLPELLDHDKAVRHFVKQIILPVSLSLFKPPCQDVLQLTQL